MIRKKGDKPADNLRYTKTHEWIQAQDNAAIVGLSHCALEELAELVFLELPALGRELTKGEACAVVESVKTISDIYAPASGKVIAVNAPAAKNLNLIQEDCYGAGWLFKLQLARPEEMDALLTPAQYREHTNAK